MVFPKVFETYREIIIPEDFESRVQRTYLLDKCASVTFADANVPKTHL